MSLTKRQKRFLIESCDFLTLEELSKKTGVEEKEIETYLKKNNKKAVLVTKNLISVKENAIEENNLGVKEILKKSWKFLLLISIGVIFLYLNSLKGNFVSDDYASISQNPNIGDAKTMLSGFNSTYIINYFINALFGNTSPVAYHIVSLILYIIFIWVAYVAIRMVIDDDRTSKIMMAIFAVLPVHVESVSWISGRIYLLVSLWVMLGFISFMYLLRKFNWKYVVSTLVFFGLGFLTDKPRPFALIFIIILFLLFKKINLRKLKIFNHWPIILGLIFVAIIIAWPTVISRIESVNSGYNSSESIFYNPFFQYPTAISKYLQLLLVPTDLTLYHTMYILPVWLNWLILLTYLFLVGYFYYKDKRLFFALVFIFAATAPSMAPVKVSWLVAERYVFLGSLGFCLFLAIYLDKIWRKNSYVAVMLLAALMSIYSVRVYLRNVDWQTNHNLWVNTCQVSPNSHNAWNNIGDDYDKLNQYDNAVKGFTQSTLVKPNYADAYHNRANIFFKMGRLDLARDSYETALKYSPGLFQTYFSLVQIDLMENRLDLAFNHASAVLKMQPNLFQSRYVMGVVLAQMGNKTDSLKELQLAVQLNPGFQPAIDLIKTIQTGVNSPKK